MAVRILGMVVDGLEAVEVTLEARYSQSLRVTEVRVVGLPDAAVKEGMLRARSAAGALLPGVHSPSGILVNLSPADVRKSGRSVDLPLAMVYAGLLLGVSDPTREGLVFLGELGLAGAVRPVVGTLSAVMEARRKKRAGIVLPRENLEEARLVQGPPLFPVSSVEEAFQVLLGSGQADEGTRGPPPAVEGVGGPDLCEVRGQYHARRALEVAASGGHNLLFEGPPGSGKTMLARRVPGILPLLDDDAALEVARIRSVVRALDVRRLHEPPFRAPHHTATPAGLVGGGVPIRPGEFSQSHHGVLFLDELPEFERRALEALREPLEEGAVHITRASGVRSFPADFMLIAAMNPCPCGFFGLADGRCTCTPRRVQAYRARLSGPLLDRFDMRVLLRPVPAETLLDEEDAEPTAAVRKRVLEARSIQRDRYAGSGFIPLNGRAPERSVRAAARLGDTERRFFLRLVAAHRLSARATRRLERVARTIADLEGEKRIRDVHLMEALGFRLGGEMEGRVEEDLAAAAGLRAKTQGEAGGVAPDPDPDQDPHPHP